MSKYLSAYDRCLESEDACQQAPVQVPDLPDMMIAVSPEPDLRTGIRHVGSTLYYSMMVAGARKQQQLYKV